jgi:hypothetical protein
MPDTTHISITEVTVSKGKKTHIGLIVDGKSISIPVDAAIFAHYSDQISRKNPTEKQRKVFATVMNLMRAAYLKGCADGKTRTKANPSV